jgi:hypothetical protein
MQKPHFGVAVVALLDFDLNAADAVDRSIPAALRRNGLPLLLVQHIAKDSGCEFRALVLLWRARKCLGVLPQAFDQSNRAVDLAGDPVAGGRRLLAGLENLELLFRPLRAVVIAPGFLLLVDFLGLVAEVIEIRLLALLQRPIAGFGRVIAAGGMRMPPTCVAGAVASV